MAYQNGYQEGKQEYCEQSAYMLGVVGRPYFGICDDVDPFFQHDYDAGRMSSAGALFVFGVGVYAYLFCARS